MSFFSKLFCLLLLCAAGAAVPARAATTQFTAMAGDGRVAYVGADNSGCTQGAWATARLATTGTPDFTSPTRSILAGSGCLGLNAIVVSRAFFAFDTSAIPQNAVITAAKLKVHITAKRNSSNDGSDFVAVVQGFQSSPTSLVSTDYMRAGSSTTGPAEGSDRVDITGIATDTYQGWNLNATGLTWIVKGGYTILSVREGHDMLDMYPAVTPPATTSGSYICGALSESTKKPYLEVTYTLPSGGDTMAPTVALMSPSSGQTVSNYVTVSANASDNVAVAGVQFRVDGSNYGPEVTGAPYQVTWDTTTATNSNHNLTAVARDLAGNVGLSSGLAVTVSNVSAPAPGASSGTIVVNPSITHQTISGWEATAQAGLDGTTPSTYALYRDHVLQLAVNDLGINRIRLEWKNSSGTAIDFALLDNKMMNIVKPMQQMMQARGEKLIINLCYVGFNNSGNTYRTDPSGYASGLVTVTQYLQKTYGIVPDYFEAILEPDNAKTNWSGAQIAANIAAAGDALVAAGIQKPKFVGPSTMSAPNAITVFDAMAANAKALGYLDTISYHRYLEADAILTGRIAQRGATYGKNTAMLERIGKTYTTLHLDLKTGNNSAWQQYTLAYPASTDGGAQYYVIDVTDPANPQVVMGSRTKFLRQYFKFIRSGAIRVDATSTNSSFDPVAFRNTTGKYVVVVNAVAGGTFSIGGLPAGTYGIKYTTATQYDVNLPDAIIGAGQAVQTSIPALGVITIYGK